MGAARIGKDELFPGFAREMRKRAFLLKTKIENLPIGVRPSFDGQHQKLGLGRCQRCGRVGEVDNCIPFLHPWELNYSLPEEIYPLVYQVPPGPL